MPTSHDSVMAHLSKVPPATLYHYTSLEVLQKIVEMGNIWASDVRYLNDSTEYSHVINMIDDRVQDHLQKADGEKGKLLSELSGLLRKGSESDLFVSCFSTKRDDLSQWRGYCPEGSGVCIGFNTQVMKVAIGPRSYPHVTGLMSEVMYISKKFAPRFDEWIDIAIQLKPTEVLNVTGPTFVSTILNLLAPFYKHDSFSEEKEWRILFNLTVEAGTKFRRGKSTLIPYREVDLKSDSPMFINELIVGPSPNMDLSMKATRKLLQVVKMEYVVVHESRVPYRHW